VQAGQEEHVNRRGTWWKWGKNAFVVMVVSLGTSAGASPLATSRSREQPPPWAPLCPCGRTAPTPFFSHRLRGQGGGHTVKQRRPGQRSERTSGLEQDLACDGWKVPHAAGRGWPAPPRKPVQPRHPPPCKRPHIPLHTRQRRTTTLLSPPTSTADKNNKHTHHSSTSARAAPPPIPRRLRRRIQQRAAAAVAEAPPRILPDALHRG